MPLRENEVQDSCDKENATWKYWGFETPPPGPAVTTVTVAVPGEAISAAVIDAVNCELLTKVVVLGLPFQFTTEEPETKPVPVTVKVNAAPPGVAASGCRGFKYGTGLEAKTIVGNTAEKTTTRTNGKKLRISERFIYRLLLRTKRSPRVAQLPRETRQPPNPAPRTNTTDYGHLKFV
jgi:hypothetical protein